LSSVLRLLARGGHESPFRATLLGVALTALSKLLGLVKNLALARFAGVGPIYDSFLVALTVPGVIAGLVCSAIPVALVPLFLSTRHREGDESAWKGVGAAFGTFLPLFALASVVSFLFAPQIVALVAPKLDPYRAYLSSYMSRNMSPLVFLWGALGLLQGVLRANGRISLSQLGDPLINLTMIAFLLLFFDLKPGFGLWGGYSTGLALGVFALWAVAKGSFPHLRLRFAPFDPFVRETMALIWPVFLANGVGILNALVDRYFASGLPPGAISALSYAFLLRALPSDLLCGPLCNAFYSFASSSAARDDRDSLVVLTSRSFSSIVLALLPISIVLAVGSRELVELVFQRGNFDERATHLTAQALVFYAPGLLPQALWSLLSHLFWAHHDTKTPTLVASAALLFNAGANALLVGPMGHRGLALATSLSSLLGLLLVAAKVRRRFALPLRPLLVELLKVGLAALAALPVLLLSLGSPLLYLLSSPLFLLVCFSLGIALRSDGALLLLSRLKRMALILRGLG